MSGEPEIGLHVSTTPNFNLNLPDIGGDWNAWGDETNANWTWLDGALLPVWGGEMTGPLTLAADPAAPMQPVTLQYFDAHAASAGPVESVAGKTGVVTLVHTDISDWALAVTAAVAPAMNNVGRNLLHNPLFNVAQRGNGPWSTGYTVDRWTYGGATDAVQFLRTFGGGNVLGGDEDVDWFFVNNFTGNTAAGAYSTIQQPIEGVRRLSGKTVTLSFWGACTSGTLKLGINYLQSPGTGGSPSAPAWSSANGQSVTLTAIWTRYSVTTTLASMTDKTLGTNGDDNTRLALAYSSGATNNALFGNIGVQTGSIYLWGVQLEIGNVATPLEKPDPRYDLANCQRFYQTVVCSGRGIWSTTMSVNTPSTWPQMRAVPTAALLTNGAFANVNALALTPAAPNGGQFGFATSAAGDGYAIDFIYSLSADL